MRVSRRVYGREPAIQARLPRQLVLPVVVAALKGRVARSVRRGVIGGTVETIGQGARRGVEVVRCRGDGPGWGESHRRGADRDAVLAVVDPSAIGEDVDVGAFGPELAVPLAANRSARDTGRDAHPGRTNEAGRLVHTLAKYLQIFSLELDRSWLKGQALPA